MRMSDDITFCFNNHCRNRECEWNPVNIQVPYRPHSFGFFKDCEYWDVPETFYSASVESEESKNDA